MKPVLKLEEFSMWVALDEFQYKWCFFSKGGLAQKMEPRIITDMFLNLTQKNQPSQRKLYNKFLIDCNQLLSQEMNEFMNFMSAI